MPVYITWHDVALRLGLTLIAGAVIGFNRDERGRPAGLRTTILVCLASSVAMLQANLLMPTIGKAPNSFVVLDLMRLPLGILTGIGFIGGGAILRRDDLVKGVTTAATIWLVTVIGLCFGGGQLGLGVAATVLAIVVLWNLRWVARFIPRVRRATLVLEVDPPDVEESGIRRLLLSAHCQIETWGVLYGPTESRIESLVSWKGPHNDPTPPGVVRDLTHFPGVKRLEWKP